MMISRSHTTLYLACLLAMGAAQQAKADPSESWSGCYVGANAGYGEADIKGTSLAITSPNPIPIILNDPIGSAAAKGGALGGQFGCDYQAADWVLGAQISLDAADLEGDHLYIGGSSPSNRVRYDINRFGTLTGRVGYLLQTNTLPYLKAGAAWTRTNHRDADSTVPVPYHGTSEITRKGWLLGIGVEHKIQQNLSIFVEYDYMDFGKEKTTINYTDGFVYDYSFKQDMNYLGIGMNYRF